MHAVFNNTIGLPAIFRLFVGRASSVVGTPGVASAVDLLAGVASVVDLLAGVASAVDLLATVAGTRAVTVETICDHSY
jgi:hypothetical protein